MNRSTPRAFQFPLAASIGLSLALLVPAAFAQPDQADFTRMNEAASDTATAAAVIPNLRSAIASASDSTYAGAARQLLLHALVTSHASPRAILAAADSTLPYLGTHADRRAAMFASVSQALAERGVELPKAVSYARRAMREAAAAPDQGSGLRSWVIETLGYVHMKSGNADSAITYLAWALPTSPDSQRVLIYLGNAYAKKGQLDTAISSYVRSLAVFPARDTAGSGALRAAYLRRYNTLQGLDARLTGARRASRENVALEPRRHDAPAPAWTLDDLDGKPVNSSSLAGKIVVMDFWGSWCGPCRMELPLFEELYQQHRNDNHVVFIGVNWERDRERHAQIARDYMKSNNLSFPVVIDPDQKAVQKYGIQGFPTVFVIDAKGQIRYQNIGLAQNIEDILEAQVQSLLE